MHFLEPICAELPKTSTCNGCMLCWWATWGSASEIQPNIYMDIYVYIYVLKITDICIFSSHQALNPLKTSTFILSWLQALLLGHPGKRIRDTARFPPLMLPRRPGGKPRARALRELAAEQLGLTIQVC